MEAWLVCCTNCAESISPTLRYSLNKELSASKLCGKYSFVTLFRLFFLVPKAKSSELSLVVYVSLDLHHLGQAAVMADQCSC